MDEDADTRRYIRREILQYIDATERVNWARYYIENEIQPREQGIRNLEQADQIYRNYFNVSNSPVSGSPEHLTKFWNKQVLPVWRLVSIERAEITGIHETTRRIRQQHRDNIELAIERLTTLEQRETERRYFNRQALGLDEVQFLTYHTTQEIIRSRTYHRDNPYEQIRGTERDILEDSIQEDVVEGRIQLGVTEDPPGTETKKLDYSGYFVRQSGVPRAEKYIPTKTQPSQTPKKPKTKITWGKLKTKLTWGKPKRTHSDVSKDEEKTDETEKEEEEEDRKPPAKKKG
jgi:hypothetical protein